MYQTTEIKNRIDILANAMGHEDPAHNLECIEEFTESFHKGFEWDMDTIDIDAVASACELFLAKLASIAERRDRLQENPS